MQPLSAAEITGRNLLQHTLGITRAAATAQMGGYNPEQRARVVDSYVDGKDVAEIRKDLLAAVAINADEQAAAAAKAAGEAIGQIQPAESTQPTAVADAEAQPAQSTQPTGVADAEAQPAQSTQPTGVGDQSAAASSG